MAAALLLRMLYGWELAVVEKVSREIMDVKLS